MKPIRLMVLIPTLRGGGTERAIADLLERFDRRLIRPELTCAFTHKPVFSVPRDVPVHVLEELKPPRRVKADPPPGLTAEEHDAWIWLEMAATKLARLVRRRGAECVLASPIWSCVVSVLSRGRCSPSTRFVCRMGAYASHAVQRTQHGRVLTMLAQGHLNEADRIVAPGRGAAMDLAQHFGVEAEKIVVMPNGVDLDRVSMLSREEAPLPAEMRGDPIVLYVGRLEKVKGTEHLLRAMARVQGAVHARCLLIGDGTERRRLEVVASELGIAGHTTFLGWQENPYAFMRQATVLAIPSLSEGMSNVMLEAMACGCAIVATDVPSGSARETLGDNCGLLVAPGDDAALADAILRLLRDPPLRDRLARNARARAEAFSLAWSTTAYEQLIRNVIREPRCVVPPTSWVQRAFRHARDRP